jgi:hypothetical protein
LAHYKLAIWAGKFSLFYTFWLKNTTFLNNPESCSTTLPDPQVSDLEQLFKMPSGCKVTRAIFSMAH